MSGDMNISDRWGACQNDLEGIGDSGERGFSTHGIEKGINVLIWDNLEVRRKCRSLRNWINDKERLCGNTQNV